VIIRRKNMLFVLVFLGISFCLLTINQKNVIAEENLLPLPPNSSFVDQIDIENYPSQTPPEHPQLLRWDFSGTEVYLYDFYQKILITNQMDGMFGGEEGKIIHQSLEGNGKLSLKSEGNGNARFVLENLTINMEVDIPGREEPKTIQSQSPPMVVQGFQEDGQVKLSNNSQQLLFKTLFPIPPKSLKIEESVSVPVEMPFNAMGSLLNVKGSSVIKLADYVLIDGKACAKLETTIDISKMNIPKELEGVYICRVKGKSIFYFDIYGRHFVSGRVALLMSIRVEAPTPRMNFPEETKGSEEMPETIKMAMDSDNFLSVKFIDN